ncbi:MAG: hypothetical protein R3Y54_03935 [Eubacteriales bacterium]
MVFELTNKQREYLGLELVLEHWVKIKLSDECYAYFDGDIVKKRIQLGAEYYLENEMNVETANEGSILLPKTYLEEQKVNRVPSEILL